jgi:hypothetical protein
MRNRRTRVVRLGLQLLVPLAFTACHVVPRDAGDPASADASAHPWLLVAPPNLYRDGGARMDDRAPLWKWQRLAAFDDVVECRRFRDARIADAPSDEEWAMWSMSRCMTAERAEGGRLAPGE